MIEFNKYMKKKLVISYEITKGCNLRCPYCYMSGHLDNAVDFDSDMANTVIQKFKEFLNTHPDYQVELDLLGGDPLFCSGTLDFVERWLKEVKADIWIVTNLTPKDQNKIVRLGELLKKYDRLGLSATWHDSCDQELWKSNMKYLSQFKRQRYAEIDEITFSNIVASLVLMNDKVQYEKYQYMKDHNIAYGITHYYSNDHLGTRVFSHYDKYSTEIYKNSVNFKQNFFTFTEKGKTEKFGMDKFEELKLFEISWKYNLVCSVLNYNITYEGKVFNSCSRRPRIEYDLSDGIQTPKIFCKDTYCHCSISAYKQLHTLRNTPERENK